MAEVLAAALDCNRNALMNHPDIDWSAVRASTERPQRLASVRFIAR